MVYKFFRIGNLTVFVVCRLRLGLGGGAGQRRGRRAIMAREMGMAITTPAMSAKKSANSQPRPMAMDS